jgi:hypothetical protein
VLKSHSKGRYINLLCQRKNFTIHMKHSGVHAGDLFTVMLSHHLVRNAVWIRADFKLSFEFSFLYILLPRASHHRKVPLNVRRYSVVVNMVYFATLPVLTYFLVDKS